MRFAIWWFGVICGIVFKLIYDWASAEDKNGVIIIAFFVALAVSLVDGIQSLPDKKDDKEVK